MSDEPSNVVRTYVIPKLATVSLDTRNNERHMLKIVLAPNYQGDLLTVSKQLPGPDEVYLECDQVTAVDNAALAKFVEEMTHTDHDGDGTFDCDDIIDAIEEAMWLSREKPDRFHRPSASWFDRLCMSIMPPAPERHIVFSYGKLQPRFRKYHHLAAIPMLLAVIGLMQLQIHLLPWTRFSVVSGWTTLAEKFGIAYWLAILIFIVALNLSLFRKKKPGRHSTTTSRHTYGFFNKAAVYEEQGFREGAENWNFQQRLRSCLAFGAIHMANLIYPLASILPLALGGALFMYFYLRSYRRTHFRRAAVLNAAIWHRVYNRMALIALCISLTTLLGYQVLGLIGVFAFLALASIGIRPSSIIRNKERATPELVTK